VYRVGFGLEQTLLLDRAGPNLYQGTIPGQRAGALVRYQVVATNEHGTARYPRSDDTITYDGVVVTDPGRPASAYPVVEWFYEDPTSTNSVIAYEGKVYDSVTTYLRRGRHWKVELPKGHLFAMPGFTSYPLDEFAFNVPDQPGWAKTMARAQLWYAVTAQAGEPKIDSFTVRVDTNGTPWEIRAFQANRDDQWRKYHGLEGSLYEFGSSGIEKKSPKDGNFSELDALDQVINGPKNEIFDVHDVSRMVNFAAVTSLICHWDNAYELYLNGVLVGTGNDWFNAQTFYTLPLRLGRNVIAVKGIDAGLVAGMLAEVVVSGQRIGTNSAGKVSVQEEPRWNTVDFDDRGWAAATAYGSYGVEPWGTRAAGIPEATPAQWIWSADNEGDDAVYLRYSFFIGPVGALVDITTSVDNTYEIYLNGAFVGTGNDWFNAQTFSGLALQPGRNVIAVKGTNTGLVAGMLAEIAVGGQRIGTSSTWKVSVKEESGWNTVDFDDGDWVAATAYGGYGVDPWRTRAVGIPVDTPAQWIWSANNSRDGIVYFRYTLVGD
jgi:hypothetical protein